jgi:hypothetical protein
METAARNINQALNETTFNNLKDTVANNTAAALGQTGLPAEVVAKLTANLEKAFTSLKYTPVTGDIRKVNNAEGFIQTAFPLYIFLTYFIGSVMMTFAHSWIFKSLGSRFSRSQLFLTGMGINAIYSMLIPLIVVLFVAGFGISFNQGFAGTWLLLAAGLFTFLSLFQMFFKWLGLPGMGIMVFILFPLQLVASGLMYSREILPAFYAVTGDYLPATYFGSGIIKIFYGGHSVAGDIGILLLMAGIFIVVTALALLKKEKTVPQTTG